MRFLKPTVPKIILSIILFIVIYLLFNFFVSLNVYSCPLRLVTDDADISFSNTTFFEGLISTFENTDPCIVSEYQSYIQFITLSFIIIISYILSCIIYIFEPKKQNKTNKKGR